jgi:hypothetical protein
MKSRMVRGGLWLDMRLEELMEFKLFKRLDELYKELVKRPALFRVEEDYVLNETGRAVTWLVYESRFGMEPDMEKLEREIYARMGSKEDALTVMSLVYAAVNIVNQPPLDISKRTKNELSKMIKEDGYNIRTRQFVKNVNREGEYYNESFLPYNEPTDELVAEEPSATMYQEEYDEEPVKEEKKGRVFTLDEIVEYAKENNSLEESRIIQLMLFNLLVEDGTKEERTKVSSITAYILNRDKPAPQHVEHQTVIPKVEHYYDKVDKVENKFPPMGDPNKLIE